MTTNFDPIAIFSQQTRQVFDEGAGHALIQGRNAHLGNLLLAERNIYYLQILYAMLQSRRRQELEPLYEDLFDSCREAQSLVEGKDYLADQFRSDLDQLTQWGLVDSRIEKERIRGYRDNRKRKFRFSLSNEAGAFLMWLEERLQDDLEDRTHDARNQLEDVGAGVKDLLAQLRRFDGVNGDVEVARRVIHQLLRVEEITQSVHVNLSEFNARLLSFITRSYNHRELRGIIVQLETYLQEFLRKMAGLNQEVMPQLQKLNRPKNINKIQVALEIMEEERKRAPIFLRGNRQNPEHRNIPKHLLAFHRSGGLLDQLCGRIHESAFLVVRKMYAYLRELERKSHRIEDIRERLTELARLDEDQVPRAFFFDLLRPVQMCADPHHWNDHEKADPPKPRKYYSHEDNRPRNFLQAKRAGGKPAHSMQMQRMLELDDWLQARVFPNGRRASQGAFDQVEDFARLIRLATAGYLGGGKRLATVGYRLETLPEKVSVGNDDLQMHFRDMTIEDMT